MTKIRVVKIDSAEQITCPLAPDRLTTVEDKVDKILTNHLPHLEKRLVVLDTKMWFVLSILLAVFLAVLVPLIPRK